MWIDSLDDSDDIVEWPEDDYFTLILEAFLATGLARIGPVGNCTAEFFSAVDYVPFAVKWMEQRFAGKRSTA